MNCQFSNVHSVDRLQLYHGTNDRSTSPWIKYAHNNTPKNMLVWLEALNPDPTSDRPEIPPGLNDKPQTVDLAKIALDSRKVIARKTYATLFPLILKAAHEGKTFVSIREKSILKSIEISLQPLSQMFFENNNLHKIMCSPEECTLMLCKTSSRWRREVNQCRSRRRRTRKFRVVAGSCDASPARKTSTNPNEATNRGTRGKCERSF